MRICPRSGRVATPRGLPFGTAALVLVALIATACGGGGAEGDEPAADSAPDAAASSDPDTPADTGLPAPTVAFAEPIYDAPVPVIQGNQLVDGTGAPLQLRGVNRAGSEYACAQGWGFFDGAADQPLAEAIASWGTNAVRVPVNEHCWLGRNGVDPAFGGQNYRDALTDWVNVLHEAGQVVILPLMWSQAGEQLALDQAPMANTDHSLDFWSSFGAAFKDDPHVIFELYGEPHDVSWDCWQFGCVTSDGFPVAGMQSLLDALRATGATQPVIVSGLQYSNDLGEWLERVPSDPAGQLAAGLHLYNFNQCTEATCWDNTFSPIMEEYPLITAELGEDTCDGTFIETFLDWADPKGVSYLAWTWNPWGDCAAGPTLVDDELGTLPTPYGAYYRDHLAGL